MRTIALSLLFAIGVSIVLPAFALQPAYADEGTKIEGGVPSLPWQRIGQWILKNALTLLMLIEEIWRDTQSGNNPPAETPPTPPPAPLLVEAA
jgi:hypothetical protein